MTEPIDKPIEEQPEKRRRGRPDGSKDTYNRRKKAVKVVKKPTTNATRREVLEKTRGMMNRSVKNNTTDILERADTGEIIVKYAKNDYWRPDNTLSALNHIYTRLKEDKELCTLWGILEELQLSKPCIERAVTKHGDNESIKFLYELINSILEGRLIDKSLTNKISGNISTFLLKAKFDYQDKQIVENRTLNVTLVSDTRKQMLKDIQEKLALLEGPKEEIIDVEGDTIQ